MKQLKTFVAMLVFATFVAGPIFAVASPVATPVSANCEPRFAGIPPWYRGMTTGTAPDCEIVSPNEQNGGLEGFILRLVLNLIEIGIIIVGYISLFFIIYGGFVFMTNGGNASAVEKGRKTILNAVIGLAIALGAVAIVNLIFGITAT